MSSLVQPVAPKSLEAWPTRRLRALRAKLLCCEESLEQSDVQETS